MLCYLLGFHKEMLFYLIFTKICYFIVACFLEKMRYCTCTLYLCTSVAVRTPMVPLTGIFHPSAQWDTGLDTLDAFVAAIVVFRPRAGGRD